MAGPGTLKIVTLIKSLPPRRRFSTCRTLVNIVIFRLMRGKGFKGKYLTWGQTRNTAKARGRAHEGNQSRSTAHARDLEVWEQHKGESKTKQKKVYKKPQERKRW
eukprot:805521-Pelagomonas_calceolata.AAC.1